MKLNMPNLNTNLTSRTHDVEPSSIKVDVTPSLSLQEDKARRLERMKSKGAIATETKAPVVLNAITGKIQTKVFFHKKDTHDVLVTLLRLEKNKYTGKDNYVYSIMLEDLNDENKMEDYMYEFTSIAALIEMGQDVYCTLTVDYIPNQAYSRNMFTPITLTKK